MRGLSVGPGRPTDKAVTDRHLEILPVSRHRWVVRYEDDDVAIAETPTLDDARAEARNFARQFGVSTIHVHELDGEQHDEHLDPDHRAPTPRDVKGPVVEP